MTDENNREPKQKRDRREFFAGQEAAVRDLKSEAWRAAGYDEFQIRMLHWIEDDRRVAVGEIIPREHKFWREADLDRPTNAKMEPPPAAQLWWGVAGSLNRNSDVPFDIPDQQEDEKPEVRGGEAKPDKPKPF